MPTPPKAAASQVLRKQAKLDWMKRERARRKVDRLLAKLALAWREYQRLMVEAKKQSPRSGLGQRKRLQG